MMNLGIVFAIAALLSWGFGDFFIQRTTRKVGVFTTLFFIGVMAFFVLLPFVKDEFINLLSNNPKEFLILGGTAIIVFIGSLFNFESYKVGKMAVVEPILGAELPITISLAVVIWNENLNLAQIFLTLVIFVGVILTITSDLKHLHYHKRILEKGVAFAALGAVGMALTNFLTGVNSQTTSPLLAIWFIHSSLALLCLIFFIATRKLRTVADDLIKYPKIIFIESFLDNAAWLSFAYATTFIPISIATTLVEGYIALAVILGILVNKERLKRHQVIGVVLSVIGVIILSIFTK